MEVKGNSDQEEIIDNLQKWFEDNTKLPNKIGEYFQWWYATASDKMSMPVKRMPAIRNNSKVFVYINACVNLFEQPV